MPLNFQSTSSRRISIKKRDSSKFPIKIYQKFIQMPFPEEQIEVATRETRSAFPQPAFLLFTHCGIKPEQDNKPNAQTELMMVMKGMWRWNLCASSSLFPGQQYLMLLTGKLSIDIRQEGKYKRSNKNKVYKLEICLRRFTRTVSWWLKFIHLLNFNWPLN